MTYVLINPVTDRMTNPEELEKALREHGFCRASCRENWASCVLKEYSEVLQTEDKTVLDTRPIYASGLRLPFGLCCL